MKKIYHGYTFLHDKEFFKRNSLRSRGKEISRPPILSNKKTNIFHATYLQIVQKPNYRINKRVKAGKCSRWIPCNHVIIATIQITLISI